MLLYGESEKAVPKSLSSIFGGFANQLATMSDESCIEGMGLNKSLLLCDISFIQDAFNFVLKKINTSVSVENMNLAKYIADPQYSQLERNDLIIVVCQTSVELKKIFSIFSELSLSNVVVLTPQTLSLPPFEGEEVATVISLESSADEIRSAFIRVLNGEIFSLGFVRSQIDEKLSKLTPRQREVLKYICDGKCNKEIARDLDLSLSTVKVHCMAIFKELGVTSRTQAALVLNS